MIYNIYILVCVVTAVLFFNTKTIAQETPDPNRVFPLGVWATGESETEDSLYSRIEETGFNWIVQSVNQQTKPFLGDFNIITQNAKQNEWIYYYSNGKYKKWEAERDDYAFYETGIKHPHPEPWGGGPYLYGRKDTLRINGKDNICWATADSVTYPVEKVLWGPNYTQEKNYKMIYNKLPIEYTVKYRLALLNAPANPQDTICKLYVRYRAYKRVDGEIDDTIQVTLDSLYLLAEHLPGDTFHVKTLNYEYPAIYRNSYLGPLGDYPNSTGTYYDDDEVLTGIEFCLDFWGKGKLYIDYVEVYDNGLYGIWKQWINPATRSFVVSKIDSQLNNYPPAQWPNLKYWYVIDEPGSIDDYEPMRIVDSLVYANSNNNWRTINQFHPAWNGYRNGDKTIEKFVDLVSPEKVMIELLSILGR
jgi:hypothetical protein